MQQLSLVSILTVFATYSQSLFIPKNLNEFVPITTQTDVQSLLQQYPNGKILDDINDPNEKIFIYNTESLNTYNNGVKEQEKIDELFKREVILMDDGLI
ncbi:uncharacterized protein KGF55_003961 [Candida pseudojiufengensis]|uniref:uncharacterized protein n=1 Tax=Candida pseudojiufengensis TaxID=497109 RepID=UPI00222472BB|nr:uncharacterized protein KGF55_003961 [Candida pseudojiufengensis]KAI5961644.1 hypothetical protein KGF55_003961 [Candida pseudojiufengensis]